MVYKCKVSIPLIYNRHSLYTAHPDKEYRFGFDEPIKFSTKIQFVTCEIPGTEPKGVVFEDILEVMVYTGYENIKNSKEGGVNDKNLLPELICEINGLLVDDEIYARQFAEEIAVKICKKLSLAFMRHNSDRHIYQPRIEAAWSRAKFTFEDYIPFTEAKTRAMSSENAGDKVIHVEDYMQLRDSLYITMSMRIPSTEIDIADCFCMHSEAEEFLMNEYYSALGAEMAKSKFFHLFSMIEFCEQKYKKHNGAKTILDETQVYDIVNCIGELDIIKELDATSPKEKDKLSEGAYILSKVKQTLSEVNDTGRNKKLLNILNWMGIERFQTCDDSVVITEELIKSLTDLRNKSFHGKGETKQEDTQKYIEAVTKLMYIDEQILGFVEKEGHKDSKDNSAWCILGKNNMNFEAM